MDGPPAASANSSIMRRAQKIRQRMMLEMASGVPVTTRDGFLRVCLQYERDASDGSLPACDRVYGGSCDMEDILQSSSCWNWQRFDDDWADWTDWHKIPSRSGKLR